MKQSINNPEIEQLRWELMTAYTQQPVMYPEAKTVQQLKNELYRRGLKRDDIVEIALAACIRLSKN
ncbi:MAG: hypothetical protein K8L97_28355 [Anaerolineae bacterium]|nr:hypothetical protein [Anaerolineae bacterium]